MVVRCFRRFELVSFCCKNWFDPFKLWFPLVYVHNTPAFTPKKLNSEPILQQNLLFYKLSLGNHCFERQVLVSEVFRCQNQPVGGAKARLQAPAVVTVTRPTIVRRLIQGWGGRRVQTVDMAFMGSASITVLLQTPVKNNQETIIGHSNASEVMDVQSAEEK